MSLVCDQIWACNWDFCVLNMPQFMWRNHNFHIGEVRTCKQAPSVLQSTLCTSTVRLSAVTSRSWAHFRCEKSTKVTNLWANHLQQLRDLTVCQYVPRQWDHTCPDMSPENGVISIIWKVILPCSDSERVNVLDTRSNISLFTYQGRLHW